MDWIDRKKKSFGVFGREKIEERGSVKENKMPTSLAKKKKMAFQTSIAFKDLERAKNDQSSMRVSLHQLSVEASVFNNVGGTNGDDAGNDENNQMSFANVYKKESELVVAGFWFPTKGEKVTCDVLDVFLLLCPERCERGDEECRRRGRGRGERESVEAVTRGDVE